LIGPKDPAKWDHRGHFFAAAARAMRRVLIDHARSRDRNKRGGNWHRVELNPGHRATYHDPARELILDEAISRLAAEDATAAGVAALHLFAGMSIDEVAECTGVSRTTAYEQWTYARAWLRAALSDQDRTNGN
jgi:RNA polymerase sigma factor (TIGR02999 family)